MRYSKIIIKSVGPVVVAGLAFAVPHIGGRTTAAEPTCQVPQVVEPSCAVQKRLVFVPVPLCHGLKCLPRPWFMTVEPPRADVLEAVAIRREQARLSDEDLAFRIVQDRQATPRDLQSGERESSCQSSRREANPESAAAREATCETASARTAEVQRQLDSVSGRVDRLDKKIDALIGVVEQLVPQK